MDAASDGRVFFCAAVCCSNDDGKWLNKIGDNGASRIDFPSDNPDVCGTGEVHHCHQ
jgi:hypothetical protein